jgi:hypothetical protein
VYVILLFAGSGKYSIDYLLQPKTATVNRKVREESAALSYQ